MTEPPGVEAALHALYGASLESFVDERKRLSQELRRSGDRSAATRIAKWRKPSAAAWALNHVARESPELVDEWLEAGARLHDATARPAEVGGEAVRAAIANHRSATSRLLEVVRARALPGGRPLSEEMLDRARALLQTAATDGRAGELLRRGRIDEEVAGPTDLAPTGPAEREGARQVAAEDRSDRQPPARKRGRPARRDAEPTPAAGQPVGSSSAAERAATRAKAEREARERAARRAELRERVDEAEAEVKRLTMDRRKRVAAAEKAATRLDSAREALRRAEERAEAADAAVSALDGPMSEASSAVDRLRAELTADDG